MIKKIKNILVSALATAALVTPFLVPVSVRAADIQDSVCSGTGISINTSGGACTNPDVGGAEQKVNDTISRGLNIFSAIVGIIAVVMIIVGGVKYITSQGESANVTSAKNTILYALVGLVVVALAQVIVRFVIGRFVNTT
jgi:cytochrome bd-type quinol oxidase subunit 2